MEHNFLIDNGVLKKYLGNDQEVVIPDVVRKIKYGAFEQCTELKSLTISKSVQRISHNAFLGCEKLEKIVVEAGNRYFDSRNNCNAIIETQANILALGCKNTVIPENVTEIGDCAFDGCKGLRHIVIPNSVKYFGDFAFSSCNNLRTINIPYGVRHIGKFAFTCCTALIEFQIPKDVVYIGEGALLRCWSLEKISVDPENRYYDSRNNCNAVIKTKTNELLFGCKNTIIPEGITGINKWAFEGCRTLTHITIPSDVTNIPEMAFDACRNLESIVVDKKNKKYDSRGDCNAIIETQTNILVSGCKNTVIPESIKEISAYAFGLCVGLTGFVIPRSVTKMGEYAFEGCDNLTIYCHAGSYAEQYAKEQGLRYELVD